jgi:acyl-CoA thioesterase FadM
MGPGNKEYNSATVKLACTRRLHRELVPLPAFVIRACASLTRAKGMFMKPNKLLGDPRAHTMAFVVTSDMVDAAGMIHPVKVLDIIERAQKLESPNSVGSIQKEEQEERGSIFVLARVSSGVFDITAMARCGDRIEIRSVVQLRMRNCCLTFHQEIVVVSDEGERSSFFSVVSDVYCIDGTTKGPVPLTPALEKEIQRYVV